MIYSNIRAPEIIFKKSITPGKIIHICFFNNSYLLIDEVMYLRAYNYRKMINIGICECNVLNKDLEAGKIFITVADGVLSIKRSLGRFSTLRSGANHSLQSA